MRVGSSPATVRGAYHPLQVNIQVSVDPAAAVVPSRVSEL